MKLNRKLVLVLALVLSLAMATSGTLAFLTDADKDVNTMTLGRVEIVQNEQQRVDDTTSQDELEEFEQDKPLLPSYYEGSSIPWAPENEWVVPGDQAWKVVEDNVGVVDKFVTVTNTGKTPAYVRTILLFESVEDFKNDGDYVHCVMNDGVNLPDEMTVMTWVTTDKAYKIGDKYYQIGYVTYTQPLEAGATSIPSLKQIYMDKAADNEYMENFGDDYEVIALSQAVQTQGFEDAEKALNEGFGAVTPEKVAEWLGETEIGSPDGEKNDTNNPPEFFTGDPAALAELLAAATDAGSGDVTVELEESYDMTGFDWDPISVDGYHGAGIVTVEGNGHTIKGLNAPLFAGGFAGRSGIVINDLTIADSTMTAPTDQGSGTFICCADSMTNITLDNCHAKNVTLNGASRTGGLIGWTSGYSRTDDGPVKSYVTIADCTVEGCTINAEGESAGGFIGHSGASDWTFTTVTNSKVIDTEINGGSDRTGIYLGTSNIGETTFTGCSYENVTGDLNSAHPLYGRTAHDSTGKLTIDGAEIN